MVTAQQLGAGGGTSNGVCAANSVALAELICELEFVLHHINTALEVVCPEMCHRLVQLHDNLVQNCPSYTLLGANKNPCHLSSLGLIFNKVSGAHFDSAPPGYYDALLGAGKHTQGGDMVLTDLGIAVPFKPGDFIMLCGRLLKHHTTAWHGLARCTLVFFCQEGVLRGMEIDTLLDV